MVDWTLPSKPVTLFFFKSAVGFSLNYYMSILWRGFGLCCALGCALIAVFLKNCYLTILDFSSSCLTQNNELKGSWSLYFNSFLSINLQSNKSHSFFHLVMSMIENRYLT
uniref:Uncharacterized protein n=1 Tax=Candidatus Kentrum eta TaxID=2126337 RepID=A0A450VNI8_9GAMM|nr:MAG: hypothetical protein BECKH772A_GA0070896_105552 [Candidatus Kentron sp. H]VFK06386.1 MAG: hypothetical protein BECKH772B_GA0070898_106761 [Candidatus Kentron sp. H]VFK08865.1 MAG: hypothetical protein BECKH772C_GA0070978_105542 [Candidatus Kentron sp. H]